MDLRFQVPMQYCSLQHWTLLLSPVTSTSGYCFCFGSIPSFLLELFIHWSLVAYRVFTSSSFSILSFCLFILFMGFSRSEYWSGLPFPSPVDHILSDQKTRGAPRRSGVLSPIWWQDHAWSECLGTYTLPETSLPQPLPPSPTPPVNSYSHFRAHSSNSSEESVLKSPR